MLSVAIKTFIIATLLIFILHFLIKNTLQDRKLLQAVAVQEHEEHDECSHSPPPPPATQAQAPPSSEDLDDYFASIKAAPPPAPIQAPTPSPQRSAVASPLGFDGMYGSSFSLL